MDPKQHHDAGFWSRVRPQDSTGWLYWIAGILLAIVLLGAMCLYVPAMLAG